MPFGAVGIFSNCVTLAFVVCLEAHFGVVYIADHTFNFDLANGLLVQETQSGLISMIKP